MFSASGQLVFAGGQTFTLKRLYAVRNIFLWMVKHNQAHKINLTASQFARCRAIKETLESGLIHD